MDGPVVAERTADREMPRAGGKFLAALALVVPLWVMPPADESFTLAKLSLILFALACAGLVWVGRGGVARLDRVDRTVLVPLLALAGIVAVSSAVAPLGAARWGVVRSDIAVVALLVAGVLAVRTAGDLRAIAVATAMSAGAGAIVLIVQGAGGAGPFGNPSFAAAFLGMAAPAAAAAAVVSGSPRTQVACGLAAVLAILATAMTGSRAGWFAGGAGLAVWAVLSRDRIALLARRGGSIGKGGAGRALPALVLVLVAGFTVGILAAAGHPGDAGRLRARASEMIRFRTPAIGNRLLMWRVALLQLADRPVLGHGSGGYRRLQIEYQARFIARPAHARWLANWTYSNMAHNDLLQALAEWGVVGAGLLIWAFVALASRLAFAWRRAAADGRVLIAASAGSAAAFVVDGVATFPLHLPSCAVLLAVAFASPAAVAEPSGGAVSRPGPGVPGTGPRLLRIAAVLILLRAGWEAVRAQTADILVGGGMRRAMAGDLSGGRIAFARATRLDPWNGKAWLDRGTGALMQEDLGGAIDALDRAERLQPDPGIPYNLGLAWAAMGRTAEARASLARAVYLKPAFPEALTSLAELAMREGRVDEAVGLLRDAIRASPGYILARRQLGFAYYHQGDRRAALDQLLWVAARQPGDAHVEAMLDRIRREGFDGKGMRKR